MKKNCQTTDCSTCDSKGEGIFKNIPDDQIKKVSEKKVHTNYKKNTVLFEQGESPSGIFCINDGSIKLTKIGADGKESIIRLVGGGDILGHRSLFTNVNYNATATVINGPADICFFPKSAILELVNENPSIAFAIIEKLGKEMGAAEEKVVSFYQKNVRERLAELLLLLKNKYGEKRENGEWKINLKLTREEMATMIGTANETLIRFVSELKEENLIRQEGKNIIILDTQRLIEFANIDC